MDFTIFLQRPNANIPFWEDVPANAEQAAALLQYHKDIWGDKFIPKHHNEDPTLAIYKYLDVDPAEVVKFYNDLCLPSHPLYNIYFNFSKYFWLNEFVSYFDKPEYWPLTSGGIHWTEFIDESPPSFLHY